MAGAAVLVLAAGGWYWRVRVLRAHQPERPIPDVTASAGDRIRVEVLNATKVRGLARRATFYLRDRGFDVVTIGTSPDQRDSTVVFDRTNHPQWARRVADAMGNARVEARPDSTFYVDVTVLIGRSWRPPPEPLHP